MRVLVTIPHYFSQAQGADAPRHGSLGGDPGPRIEALTDAITALHRLYGPDQRIIEIASRLALPVNTAGSVEIEVVVCTTGADHLLPRLTLPTASYRHHATDCPPPLLGFECHAVLRDRLGEFDYYGYLEDDLVCRDPWMFRKLSWFTDHLGDGVLLQPNRYEVCPLGFIPKAYIDGDLHPSATAPYQDVDEEPVLSSRVLGVPIDFRRARNPHAGCFFLNARQMRAWAERPDFLDRDTGFVGPLESAATLGIMRTFRVYKTAAEHANFLEIEHHGTAFIRQLRLQVAPTPGGGTAAASG